MVIPPGGATTAQSRTLVAEDDTEFTSPRWSPDATLIAAERRRLGGPSEIVLVDAATGSVRTLTTSADGRNISPMWMPDGAAVIFASDRGGGPFTLYRVNVQTGAVSRIDAAGAGAQSPAALARRNAPGIRRLLGGRLRSLFAAERAFAARQLPTPKFQLPTRLRRNFQLPTPNFQLPRRNIRGGRRTLPSYTAVADAGAAVLGSLLRRGRRRRGLRRRDRRFRCARAAQLRAVGRLDGAAQSDRRCGQLHLRAMVAGDVCRCVGRYGQLARRHRSLSRDHGRRAVAVAPGPMVLQHAGRRERIER